MIKIDQKNVHGNPVLVKQEFQKLAEGLEGVVAANTILSDVDGVAGRLVIRGFELGQLAGRTRFGEVAHLLLDGFFDDLPEPAGLEAMLGAARVEAFAYVDAIPAGLNAVEAVRALLARIPDGDDLRTAIRLLAGVSVFTAAVARQRQGHMPLPPDPEADHATDMLRMIRGSNPTVDEAAALDTYLVTVCDHGLNASTFAVRVTASTLAGLTSAVLTGISTLKGPLHGGAPGPVVEMLDEIGEASNARAWIERAIDRGERLMGFGHRIYRVRDPRADALKLAVRPLSSNTGRLALAEAVESAALQILSERKPDRSLQTNVEFYTALLLEALGFEPAEFTCVFAMGRTLGWIAHAREQVCNGRLIRPASVYVGPVPKIAA
ncbi:citrate synthase/methylcitrate synthase [Sphingomonas sanguinis]|uniref:citrate synthase/methylcitrate synthase n=1 Tax=Sphingomonas sanguinis TaxID=33051 RepID=UPI0019D370A5|nr:citrate synthase/methylcitrate synthase [Sphingomonas sanguinis]